MHNERRTAKLPWHVGDLDLSAIDTSHLRENDDIFLLVCSASFVESGTATYAHNLAEYFADDAEIGEWLREHWEPEELQHGLALKAYVQHVWPEFDWDAAYAGFFTQYKKLCTRDALEPTRGQELMARCIVEMGTTTYYQALSTVCDEPVLRELAWRIRTDEVGHYKHFYHHFLRYRQHENLHRWQVIGVLWRRVNELRQSDADIALHHAAAWLYRGHEQEGPSYKVVSRRVYELMRPDYPIDLAVRMALKPLQFNALLQHWAERPLAAVARWLLLH